MELDAARGALGDKVKVFVEGGRLAGGAPSTVVAIERAGMRVLRAGAVSERQMAAALRGDVIR